ncbi:response regulator [Paenibacillus sp. MBLB2552]|uniref:Response regulator n=1 Tax=Paenibacillus mellifer TaxID=2937794 RepID=A0A9X1Y0Y9_9BACL|nr:response regulator [Paenibacillus mellifer]MCK8489565.1 response regulator [Paenibacillus mellifer]
MMKKVLLVDDEILVRENIRDCIPWEREGFDYLGDASDGEMALPMIEQLQPDILITDIKMPFMNGLELCHVVRAKFPQIKIIILSGHGEFDYARKALSLGVEEYCLKPISASDLVELLHGVSHKIDRERSEKEQLEGLMRRELEKAGNSRHKLLSDLCGGLLSAPEAIQTAETLSVSLVARWYAAAIVDLRPAEPSNVEFEAAGCPEWNTVLEYIQKACDHGQMLQYPASRTKQVYIVKGDTEGALKQTLEPFRRILALFEEPTCRFPLFLGLGSGHERIQGIHLSFLEAEESLYWQRLTRQNRQNLLEVTRSSIQHSILLDRQAFVRFLKIGTSRHLSSFIPEFAAVLQSVDWNASLTGYYILNDLTLEVVKIAEESIRGPGDSGQSLRSFQGRIEAVGCWDEACAYLTHLVEQFWLWRARSADRYADLLHRVKDYIAANYDKGYISLQHAAEHISMSPSHLSKIFSQETGQTFIEFLTETRIRRAMELLQSTQCKTYEIACQVGYSDAHYFSNLFKRVTGMTTTEFRKHGTMSPARTNVRVARGEPHDHAVSGSLE